MPGVIGVLRLGAAALLVAGAGVLVPATASAATCTSAEGVTVVVDFKDLGGGVVADCVANDGGTVSTLFRAAGHSLTQVTSQPGFVCRVDGLPGAEQEACNNTPPPDAYWGLWWSDGESGSWTYATSGALLAARARGRLGRLRLAGRWRHRPTGLRPAAACRRQ